MYIMNQENNLNIINSWKELPPFLIIKGDRHTGKTYLTKYICDKFKLEYVEVGTNIDRIRELIKEMKINSNTLYHLKNFETTSTQAHNAILKIAEETPIGNHIVITGSTQLKTLESRAIKLIMGPYKEENIKEYIKRYKDDNFIIDNIYKCGINTPAKIELCKDYEQLAKLMQYTIEIFTKITYISIDDITEMLQLFSIKQDKEIDTTLLFLNMLISYIEYTMCNKQNYSYKYILELLIGGKQALEQTPALNRKLLLYRIFYNIMNMNIGGQISC